MQMVRTTVYLPADLVALAKISALNTGSSLTGLVKASLEEKLMPRAKPKKRWSLGSYALGNYKFKRGDAYE
jgi:hypothetical protein